MSFQSSKRETGRNDMANDMAQGKQSMAEVADVGVGAACKAASHGQCAGSLARAGFAPPQRE
jgi:hypothetical protein